MGYPKKGQGAAEYLILLGIILIVSLIGIVLLGGFTESTTNAVDTQTKMYWSSTRPLAIIEWVQTNSTLYIKLKNMDQKRVILKSIIASNVTSSFGTGWTFAPGNEKTVAINGLTQCSANYDYFSYDIYINYDTADISNITFKGTKPLVGKCIYD